LALRLADGGEIELPKDETAHKQHLRAEMLTIERGLVQVGQQYAELHEARSIEVYEQHLKQHRAVLVSKYEGVLALVTACDAERAMISAMILAGYQHMPGIWTSPPLNPAAQLGTWSEWDSPASTFKRTLEMLGVI
jgi:hypothetical protein